MNDESESVEGIEFFLRVTKRSTLSKCTRRIPRSVVTNTLARTEKVCGKRGRSLGCLSCASGGFCLLVRVVGSWGGKKFWNVVSFHETALSPGVFAPSRVNQQQTHPSPVMPVTMKGSPMAGSWNNTPLDRFNRFSAAPVSAWEVGDGTLGTFMGQTVVNAKFASELRDLGTYGVSSPSDMKHPAWKTAPNQEQALFRTPKRMRRGIAGDELGPGFMQ